MASGEHAYQKLLTFVKENLEYFEREVHKRVEDWGVKECERVISDAFMTMGNVAMYDDCDEMMQIDGDELVAAFMLVYENYMHIDCAYYLFEKRASIQAIVGISVAYDIHADNL